MYKCLDCNLVFEHTKEYHEDLTPGLAFEGGSFIKTYDGCPYCQGAFEKVEICSDCGKYKSLKKGTMAEDNFYCQDCIENICSFQGE